MGINKKRKTPENDLKIITLVSPEFKRQKARDERLPKNLFPSPNLS